MSKWIKRRALARHDARARKLERYKAEGGRCSRYAKKRRDQVELKTVSIRCRCEHSGALRL